MLSNFTDLAMEQSKQISNLGAALQDTILWDSICPQPASSSTASPLWSEVVVRNRNGRLGQCSPPSCLNLANRYSILADSEAGSKTGSKQMPAAVDLSAAATPRRSPPPACLPAAQAVDQPDSRRLLLPGPSDAAVNSGAAAGGENSPDGGGGSRAADSKADCRSRHEDISHRPLKVRSTSTTSSIRRQLLRVAVDRRSDGLPSRPAVAAVICPRNPGSTSPLDPSADALVAAHQPSSLCALGQVGGEGEVPRQHTGLGPRPASPQLTPSPPLTIILGDSIIRNVSIYNSRTVVFPGATVAVMIDKIQDVAMSFPSADSLVLHVGTNDVGKRQSESLKRDFTRLFGVLKNLHYMVSISGPTPTIGRGGDRFSRLLGLNTWLQSACRAHNVHFIDNFNLFWQRTELFARDGLHLNYVGAHTLSSNLSYYFHHHFSYISSPQQTQTDLSTCTSQL